MTMNNPTVLPARPPNILSPNLRNQLLTTLIAQNAIYPLQSALNTEGHASDWQQRVHERILAALREHEYETSRDLLDQTTKEVIAQSLHQTQMAVSEEQNNVEDPSKAKDRSPRLDSKVGLPQEALDAAVESIVKALELDRSIIVEEEETPKWQDWK